MGYDLTDPAPLALLGYMDNALESFTRAAETAAILATGRIELSYVTAYRTQPLTQLGVVCRGVAVGTLTSWRQGLYTVSEAGDLTLVARTASQTSGTFSSLFTEYVYSLDTAGGYPATYTVQKGQRYAFGGICIFASTAPQLRCAYANNSAVNNARSPRVSGFLNSQADLLTSISAASVGNISAALYQFGLA
jgi:hypothetical protein